MLCLGTQFFADEPAATMPQSPDVAPESEDGEATIPEPVQQEDAPPAQPETPPFKLKIKYNHEEKELDEETARELAQKGMNYDKVLKEHEALKARLSEYESMSIDEIKASAQALGMTVKDYIEYAKGYADEANIQKIADTYGVDYAYAKALYETQKAARPAGSKPAEAAPPAEPVQDKLEADIHELYKAYPDVTEDDVKAIMDDYGKGVPMLAAYEKYLLKKEHEQAKARLAEYEKKLAIRETNDRNNDMAVGSLSGGGDAAPSDIYTKEELDALTPEQIRRDPDKAAKSMSYHSKKRK